MSAAASASPTGSRRREKDFAKLASEERFVVHSNDSAYEFWVEFPGPAGTSYDGGLWTLHVLLPAEYPFKSPSIGFANRIFHPNVDEMSGSVCLDVINQTWTPLYELTNVFDTFLPQLLRYPNAADPLNPEAASLQMKDPVGYASRIQEHVRLHATPAQCLVGLVRAGVKEINPRSILHALQQQQRQDEVPQQQLTPGVDLPSIEGDGGCLAPEPAPRCEDHQAIYAPDDIDI